MNENDRTRQTVSEAYANAVAPSTSGCCGPRPAPDGAIAALAGYAREQIDTLPDGVAQYTFGCGDPLAFSDVREGDVVLDLGSGAGMDILLAGKKVGPSGHVIGIDMTDAMIAKAGAARRRFTQGLPFACAQGRRPGLFSVTAAGFRLRPETRISTEPSYLINTRNDSRADR